MLSKKLFFVVICMMLFLVGGTVQVHTQYNVNNCEACNPAASCMCQKCKSNYILSYGGQCYTDIKCTVNNCALCNTSTPDICDQCNEGYYLDSGSNNCSKSSECHVDHCYICSSFNASECLFCLPPYNKSEDWSQCVPGNTDCKVDNCQTCDYCYYDICVTCKNEFHVTDKSTCAPGGLGDLAAYRMLYLLYFAVLLITVVIVAQKV